MMPLTLFPSVISIHAPPRGATADVQPLLLGDKFQFTPLREGRRVSQIANAMTCVFQFTPLREGRQMRHTYISMMKNISIHAPPRGATYWVRACFEGGLFQFTPLREGRHPTAHRLWWNAYFNSRPSARGDHLFPAECTPRNHFNSRPSARGDLSMVSQVVMTGKFQFTPLREGRQQKICNFCKSFVQPLQISMA